MRRWLSLACVVLWRSMVVHHSHLPYVHRGVVHDVAPGYVAIDGAVKFLSFQNLPFNNLVAPGNIAAHASVKHLRRAARACGR